MTPVRRWAALLVIAVACSGAPDLTDTTAPPTTDTTGSAGGGWVRLQKMAFPRSELGAAALDGRIYTFGGHMREVTGNVRGQSTVEVFDTATGARSQVADMPRDRHHVMAAAHSGKIYVFGGYRHSPRRETNTVWRYDPVADSWEILGDMPGPVAAGSAVALGDYIYVIGGVPEGTTVYRFAPATGAWTVVAPLPYPSEHLAAAVLDGTIYAISGRWDRVATPQVSVYDPATDAWSPATPVHDGRAGFGAAVWRGQIVIVGGELLETGDAVITVEAYDPLTGEWSFLEPLPETLHGMGVVSVEGAVYVVGGSRRPATANNHGDVFVLAP